MRVWVYMPGRGYVGTGVTTGVAVEFEDSLVTVEGEQHRLRDLDLNASYRYDEGLVEYILPIDWDVTVPQEEAFRERGLFANQNSACLLRDERTREALRGRFGF